MMGGAVAAMWKRSCRSDKVIVDLTKALASLEANCAARNKE